MIKYLLRLGKLLYLQVHQKFISRNEEIILRHFHKYKQITLIDVGANKGDFTALIEKRFNLKKSILIEPIPELIPVLEKRFGLHKCKVYRKAVTNRSNDVLDYNVYEYNETSSLFQFNANDDIPDRFKNLSEVKKVETITIDDIIFEEGLISIDLLKIDVQGAEMLVLQGAKVSFAKIKNILIETSFVMLYEQISLFPEVHKFLLDNGYVLKEIVPGYRTSDGNITQVDCLFTRNN